MAGAIRITPRYDMITGDKGRFEIDPSITKDVVTDFASAIGRKPSDSHASIPEVEAFGVSSSIRERRSPRAVQLTVRNLPLAAPTAEADRPAMTPGRMLALAHLLVDIVEEHGHEVSLVQTKLAETVFGTDGMSELIAITNMPTLQ